MNWAEAIAEFIVDCRIPCVFGFPGESTLPLYIALQRRKENVRHILARSPLGAAYMADAWARLSGGIGIVDTPGGIGSPFIAPAVSEAKNSSVPLLVLASGTASSKRDKWATSACNQQGLFAAISKKTVLANNYDDPYALCLASAELALSPRTGPVFVEIPGDYFNLTAIRSPNSTGPGPLQNPRFRPTCERHTLNGVVDAIAASNQIAILAGGGVHFAGASEALVSVSKRAGMPVATTLNGKGVFPEHDQLSLGVAGGKGLRSTNEYLSKCECVIVIGSKLGDKSTNGYTIFRDQFLIHVDSDPSELHPRVKNYLPVHSDARSFLEALLLVLPVKELSGLLPEKLPFWTRGVTHQLCEELTRLLPENGVLVADASVSSGWASAAVMFREQNQRLIAPRGTGSLSFALSASIGAQFARPDSKVVAIGGDGGLAMALGELETVARYKLPIKYILLNNSRLGLIDKHATELLGGKPISGDFTNVDWTAIARAFGWNATTVDSAGNIRATLRAALLSTKPEFLNVVIDADEESPDYVLTKERALGSKYTARY